MWVWLLVFLVIELFLGCVEGYLFGRTKFGQEISSLGSGYEFTKALGTLLIGSAGIVSIAFPAYIVGAIARIQLQLTAAQGMVLYFGNLAIGPMLVLMWYRTAKHNAP